MAAVVGISVVGRDFVCAGAEVVPMDLEVMSQEKTYHRRREGTQR
jgi:hypothetical protein